MAGVFIGRTHRELVAVEASNDQSLFLQHPFYDRGMEEWPEIFEDGRPRRQSVTLVADDIFDADDDPMKLSQGLAIGSALVQLLGPAEDFFRVNVYKSVEVRLAADALQVIGSHCLTRAGAVPKTGVVRIYGNMLIQEQALENGGSAEPRLFGLFFLHAFLDLAFYIRLGVVEFADATAKASHKLRDLTASE